MQGSRRRTLAAVSLPTAIVAAVFMAPAAQAFRNPKPPERKGVMRAWKKEHGGKAKKLFVEEIRVSTADTDYAATLYDKKASSRQTGTFGFGPTKVEYFKRTKGSAKDGIDVFVSLGQNVRADVRDDEDPMYRVRYSTTSRAESITRTTTYDCTNDVHTDVESDGNYEWTSVFRDVPLSRPNFRIANGSSYFSGTQSNGNPCGMNAGWDCPAKNTVNYTGGGASFAERATGPSLGGLFHSGYLVLTPGKESDLSCQEETGATPIVTVQVGLPLHWPGTPINNTEWDVDESNFTPFALDGRLDNCRPYDVERDTCTETLYGFAGRVVAERTRR